MDTLLEPRNDLTDLPKPGEIIIYDYCKEKEIRSDDDSGSDTEVDIYNESENATDSTSKSKRFKVKAVQWNIERAYKLDEIIELLSQEGTGSQDYRPNNYKFNTKVSRRPRTSSSINISQSDKNVFNYKDIPYKKFDIMAIQEFDIGCARSNYRNSPLELARALKMRCIFLSEFKELYSEKLRSARTQGGGVHGNGILTWWEVEKVEVIEHVEIFNWERDGDKLNEPREGKRRSLAAFLRHPRHPERKVIVYSVHLEVFCGIFGRMRQFSQILEHSHANLKSYPHQMILGDLNTMAHGLARFLPIYCCDGMRWGSVGWSEAEWWQRNLFAVTPGLGEGKANIKNDVASINYFLAAHHHPNKKLSSEPELVTVNFSESTRNKSITGFEQEIEDEIYYENDHEATDNDVDVDVYYDNDNGTTSTSTPKICKSRTNNNPSNTNAQSIFTDEELKNLINPHFYCPFSVSKDKTVEMRGYSGKLDWMLMRGWRVLRYGLDNELYSRSDHKLLWAEVEVFTGGGAEDLGKEAHDEYYRRNPLRLLDKAQKLSKSKNLNRNVRTMREWNFIFLGAGVIGVAGVIIYFIFNNKEM